MPTVAELDFYRSTSTALKQLAIDVSKIREAVEKCIGRPLTDTPGVQAKDEHPTDSPFDVLAVTKVEVFPYNNSDRKDLVQGLATVVINDQLTLQGLMICESRENGLYVGYPTNNYFPMTRQLKDHIENCILEKYMEATK